MGHVQSSRTYGFGLQCYPAKGTHHRLQPSCYYSVFMPGHYQSERSGLRTSEANRVSRVVGLSACRVSLASAVPVPGLAARTRDRPTAGRTEVLQGAYQPFGARKYLKSHILNNRFLILNTSPNWHGSCRRRGFKGLGPSKN